MDRGNSLAYFFREFPFLFWDEVCYEHFVEQEDPYHDYSIVCVCRLSIQVDVLNFLRIWYE